MSYLTTDAGHILAFTLIEQVASLEALSEHIGICKEHSSELVEDMIVEGLLHKKEKEDCLGAYFYFPFAEIEEFVSDEEETELFADMEKEDRQHNLYTLDGNKGGRDV
jgi:hypothetical protein